MTSELMRELIEAVLTLLGIIITAYVIPWLKQKIGAQKYDKLVAFADMCVRAADQIYESEQWSAKKAYVVGLVQKRAEMLGLDFDEKDIDAIIEGLVNILREGV